MNIILEAKRPEYPDWRMRSRLFDLNYELNDRPTNIADTMDKMTAIRVWWQQIEPYTQFRLRRID